MLGTAQHQFSNSLLSGMNIPISSNIHLAEGRDEIHGMYVGYEKVAGHLSTGFFGVPGGGLDPRQTHAKFAGSLLGGDWGRSNLPVPSC